MARNRNLEWALAYATRCAVPVFPVRGTKGNACDCGDVQCASPGKHPLTRNGLKDATMDEEQIREWWTKWPNANIGMPTGTSSMLWVLDLDLPDGDKSFEALEREHGEVPSTATQRTGSGGRQKFFAWTDEIRNSTKRVGPDIDVRGEGGYVVLPPSRHVTGRNYEWVKGEDLGILGFTAAPQWLTDAVLAVSKAAPQTNGTHHEASIPAGQRNDTLYRLARSLRTKRLKQDAVLAALLAENRLVCNPPMTDAEVQVIVGNAFKQPNRADFKQEAGEEEKPFLSVSDPMKIARTWSTAVIERPEGQILHHWDERFWQWSGAHYRTLLDKDIGAEIWRYLADRVVLLNADGDRVKPNKRIVADVVAALEAHTNIPQSVVKPPCWISAPPAITSPHLVPVRNGLLDLVTGELFSTTPKYFNVHHLETDYTPDVIAPTWLNFLDSIWGSEPEQVETLQEIFGYLISQSMDQQKMFMIIGPPRSGKGTIGQVIEALLGSDAVARPTSREFGSTFGAETLIGRSLAIISDARVDANTQAGMVETLLSVSGQDSMDVNRKHRSHWRGKLQTRFIILTNELPRLWDAAGALPTRFLVLVTRISFLNKEDRALYGKLKAETSGILNWAIQGWHRLMQRGHFIQPDTAQELMEQFRSLSSPLMDYVSERCIQDAAAICDLSTLYEDYLAWCELQKNKFPLALNMFARDLRAGYPQLTYVRKQLQDGSKVRKIGGLMPRFIMNHDSQTGSGWN